MTNADAARCEEVAFAAAKLGGRMSRAAFEDRVGAPADVTDKDGHFDVVTDTDRRVENAITDFLLAEMPPSRVLGEEGGWSGVEEPDGSTVTWMIDPIDGTSNFASGLPFFATSVAAFREGLPVAAAIYEPMLDTIFHLSDGTTRVNDRAFAWHESPLAMHEVELLTNAPYERYGLPARILDPYHAMLRSFRAVRRLGACTLHIAYVASGRAAACFEYEFYPWDIAAALPLAAAAGCSIRAWDAAGGVVDHPESHPELVRSLLVTAPGLDSSAIDWERARISPE